MKVNNITDSVNYNGFPSKKDVAFTSFMGNTKNIIRDKYIEPTRAGSMSRNLFVTAAFAFLLSGRLIKSRDNNEKRETLTRDIPTILLAVQGVPFFEKIIAKTIQNKSGFAILNNPNNCKDGIANGEQIKDWYKYDNQLVSGFKGFTERLSSLGGNLKKITSSLSEELKGQLKNFSEDNSKFMEELSNNKTLEQSVEKAFKEDGNNASKQASFKKALPKVAGIVTTLGLIGIFIPNLNIFITEAISKKKKAAASKSIETVKTEQTSSPQEVIKTAQNSSSISKKQTFAYFLGENHK